jgi:acetylornithine deacetylase/succinyl-diaminopimelate desuccinylase-like protein
MNAEFAAEARYQDGNDARVVLDDLQSLVEEFGGSLETVEENRAYRLDPTTASVREASTALEANGYPIHLLPTTFAIADANNAPRQWNAVVLSDGSINPHRSDEAISLESVDGLLRIFYDLATGAYANRN